MDSIALTSLDVMRKDGKLDERVADRVAKYLHTTLPPPLGVMYVPNEAEKLAEKVAESLDANQQEILIHFGDDCVESAGLQPQRLNHCDSSVACHHLWTSASLHQPQVH